MNRFAMGEAPVTPQEQQQYTEEAYKVVWPISLDAGAAFSDMRKSIDADGDFIATDVYGTSTGSYTIAFRNAANRLMSSAEASNANMVGTAQIPAPFGGVKYPAAGQISISITNTATDAEGADAANTIELVIAGIKLRRV